MSYRIKRVRFQRTDAADNAAWIFHQVPALDPAIVTPASSMGGSLSKRRQLDVRKHVASEVSFIPKLGGLDVEWGLPPLGLPHGPAMQQGRDSVNLYKPRPRYSHHKHEWQPDNAWIKQSLPLVTYDPALFPAMDMLAKSFRSKRADGVARTKWKGGVGIENTVAETSAPSFEQLLESYRMAVGKRFSLFHHPWQDDQSAIFANVPVLEPFNTAWFAAIASLKGDRTPVPRSLRRGLENYWTTLSRTIGVLFEDETITVASLAQVMNGYRMPKQRKIYTRGDEVQVGWVSFPEIFDFTGPRRPAMDQLLQDYWIRKPRRYDPAHMDWLDDLGWLYSSSQFDPALWPSLEAALQAFRMGDRRKIDLKRQDVPFDAWLAVEPEIYVPTQSPSMVSSMESFLVGKHRVTHDLIRAETIHDLSWLRAILDLTDAEFNLGRAHWRKIAGAIAARRRRHKRR